MRIRSVFVLLLACAELQHALPAWGLHSVGAVFLVGRMAHAISVLVLERFDEAGKLTANPMVRIVGMACTFTVLLALAFVLLYHSISTFI